MTPERQEAFNRATEWPHEKAPRIAQTRSADYGGMAPADLAELRSRYHGLDAGEREAVLIREIAMLRNTLRQVQESHARIEQMLDGIDEETRL